MNWVHLLLRGDRTANRIVPPSGFTASLTVMTSAAMAFLAVFVLALALAAGDLAARWEDELRGTATIRIPGSDTDVETRADAVLAALAQTPGILAARRIGEGEQRALLAPWFGQDVPLDSLRLPVMIEVTETADGPDREGLVARLAAEAPGAVYDDHSRWRIPLVEAASRLRFLSAISLALIAVVTGGTITLAATAALSANGQVIDVLRIVGARDGWIAAAFTRRFTMRALVGALGGTIVALIATLFLPDGVEAGILSEIGLRGWDWLYPLLVPLAAAVLAFGATHLAAVRRLREDG